MKSIKVDLEDKDYLIAKKRKGKRTWKQVIMSEPTLVPISNYKELKQKKGEV